MEVTEENAIAEVLRSHGLNEVATRLVQLIEMLDEEPDEPDLEIESLQSFAELFVEETHLPVPEIGAGPEGFVEAEWRITPSGNGRANPNERYWDRGDGVLAMKFLPTGLIRFAATSGPSFGVKSDFEPAGFCPGPAFCPPFKRLFPAWSVHERAAMT